MKAVDFEQWRKHCVNIWHTFSSCKMNNHKCIEENCTPFKELPDVEEIQSNSCYTSDSSSKEG